MLSTNYVNNDSKNDSKNENIYYSFVQACELYKMKLSYILNKGDDNDNTSERKVIGESEENIQNYFTI